MIFGSGKYSYQVVKGWGQGPDGRTLGIASGVAADSQDKVYVLDREPNPAMVVYDRDGHCLSSWGEDFLSLPHDVFIDFRGSGLHRRLWRSHGAYLHHRGSDTTNAWDTPIRQEPQVSHSISRLVLSFPLQAIFMFRTVTVSIRYIGSRPMEPC